MKNAPYVLIAIVVVAIGAWVCWQWLRSQPATTAAPFHMAVDDAFALKVPGKVVVVGKIMEGEIRPGDRLKIKRDIDEIPVEVESLEAFGAPVSVGRTGDKIGILLVGATKEQIVAGAILVR